MSPSSYQCEVGFWLLKVLNKFLCIPGYCLKTPMIHFVSFSNQKMKSLAQRRQSAPSLVLSKALNKSRTITRWVDAFSWLSLLQLLSPNLDFLFLWMVIHIELNYAFRQSHWVGREGALGCYIGIMPNASSRDSGCTIPVQPFSCCLMICGGPSRATPLMHPGIINQSHSFLYQKPNYGSLL